MFGSISETGKLEDQNCILRNTGITQERLNEMERVSSNLTKVLGSNPTLGMQQR